MFTDDVWFRNCVLRTASPSFVVSVQITTRQTSDSSYLQVTIPQNLRLPPATRRHVSKNLPLLLVRQVGIVIAPLFKNTRSSRQHLANVSGNTCLRECTRGLPKLFIQLSFAGFVTCPSKGAPCSATSVVLSPIRSVLTMPLQHAT